jgi:hypothetical protein
MQTQQNKKIISMSMKVFFSLLVIAPLFFFSPESVAGASWRYVRFTVITSRSEPTEGCNQFSEFTLLNNGSDVTWPGGSVATNPGGSSSVSENAPKAIDGSLTTKLCDTNGAGSVNLTRLVVDTGSSVTFNGYKYATGNDANGRDPITWTVEGSSDNSTWTTLDSRTSETITTSRSTYTGNYTIVQPTTTLGTGTEGSNSTIGPGASATEVNRFSLTTSAGTDTVTGLTVNLIGTTSAFTNVATVSVFTTADVLLCSATPSSNTVALTSCGISVTTTPTDYIVRITPKTHTNMPAVPGASFDIKASVVAITSTNPMTVSTFNALSQTSRNWYGMAATPSGDVYAAVYGGDIYKQTGGTGNFVALGQTSRNWYGMAATPNGDVYAAVDGGDIYKQTGGTGNFVALGQTSRSWAGMAATPSGDVYASVYFGDIYKQTGGTGNFVALGQTSRNWFSMTATANGDVYASVNDGDIYKQTGGTGNFVALGQTTRFWIAMAATPNGDVYASVQPGDIYKQTGGTGNFVALGQTSRSWYAMAATPSGDVYASDLGGDIYKASFDTGSATVTIDNGSPAGVTAATATAGASLVNLTWTNPADSDLSRIMVLASTTAITFIPVEGTTYATSTLSGASRVACYGLQTSCSDTSLTNGTAYHYAIFALDSRGNWSATAVTPSGSPATPTSGGSSFNHSRAITIDYTKVANTNQTNFPILISGTYPYLKTTTNGGNVQHVNGFDIAFYSDSALTTKLAHETESYASTTGAVAYWVKNPTLSASVDTVIYLAYGDSGITTDQSDRVNVWDANYKVVYHLAGGTTLDRNDSTSNTNNSTGAGSGGVLPTSGVGQIGGGMILNGTSQSFVSGSSIVLPGVATQSVWVNMNNQSGARMFMGSRNTGNVMKFGTNGTNMFIRYIAIGSSSGSAAPGTGSWNYFVLTRDSSNIVKLSTNGGAPVTQFGGAAQSGDSEYLHFGGSVDSQFTSGTIDEIRISNTDRSADWIATEYNNQSSTSTFYSIGVSGATLTATNYRWRSDNGNESAANYALAQNTPIQSNLFIGDRIRLRFAVSNTGSNPATNFNFLLEHASSTCTAWMPVPTTSANNTHWVMSSTARVANSSATTNSEGLTDPSAQTFVPGFFQSSSNPTPAMTIPVGRFTELEYSMRSTILATVGTNYCFRLTNGGSSAGFTYAFEPQASVTNTIVRPEAGGSSLGGDGNGTGPIRSGGGNGGGTGVDGNGNGPTIPGGGPGGGGGDSGFLTPFRHFAILFPFNRYVYFFQLPKW